jgi:hypothetical protein
MNDEELNEISETNNQLKEYKTKKDNKLNSIEKNTLKN